MGSHPTLAYRVQVQDLPHTPSTSDNVRNGVSVENVPLRYKRWFVLRVSYGRIDKAKTFVEAKGLECHVPLRYKKEVRKQGKKRIQTLGTS